MTPAWNQHIPCKRTTDERHGEQGPATKGAIVGDGTDNGEYGCHDRKADAIRNEGDVRNGFGTTQPREDTSLDTAVARLLNKV